jgi:prophage regulatory protein
VIETKTKTFTDRALSSTSPSQIDGAAASPTTPSVPPHVHHLRLSEVQQIVHYSNVHLLRLEKAGAFPRRIRLGPGRAVWRLDEILAWVESKRAASAA